MLKNFLPDNKLLIATGNKGKFVEISQILYSLNIESVPAYDFNLEEPEEVGESFAQNALIKAKYYAKNTSLISLADDSGICIVDLDNRPAIHSARFAINPKSNKRDFDWAFSQIFAELKAKNVDPHSNPKAFFICNLAIYNPQNDFSINFEGRVDGYLTFPPRGQKGFGYDPIFIKNGMEQTFGEIDGALKDKISHRGDAMSKLAEFFR